MPADLLPDNGTGERSWGLYISVPFCRFKCTYCNFASGVFAGGELERYLRALAWEIRDWKGPRDAGRDVRRESADTVYLGGGTPSMLSPAQIQALFGWLREAFRVAPNAEITLEAAPGGIDAELLAAWRACGVNRVSLGVQSFEERELKAVGRPHRAQTVVDDVAALRASGIRSVNIDLIAGLPYQTPASWEESLAWVGRLRPEHVSVYILEVDEDSRLGSEVLAGGRRYSVESLPDDDTTAGLYTHAIERLAELGYAQYEISNFALPGCESRHNKKYWELAPYAGFGVDAHSFDGDDRWANVDSVGEYLERAGRGESPVAARHAVDDQRRTEERLFLGLRQNQGVELAPAERARYQREIATMAETGLLELSGDWLRLTPRGRMLSNEVFARFIG